MTPETADRIKRTCAIIRADIAQDVADLEGAPFTGRNVSEAFGKLSASVDALAGMLARIANEVEP